MNETMNETLKTSIELIVKEIKIKFKKLEFKY